ncbi:MAG: hypothetical protein GY750_10555 [Lentisphaerae bacterium]|nr:hypothetical protein [Lentisphaerota bacterium]
MFQLSGHEDEPAKVRLELDKFDSQENIQPDKIINIYQAVIKKHAQSIIDNTPMAGGDAVHNLKLCAAAHESAQTGGKFIEVK